MTSFSTRDPRGAMAETIAVLSKQNLPSSDSDSLPESLSRFEDGRSWRLEIPSVEGPAAMRAVLEEARARGITVDRVSQGSGIFMLSESEISDMLGQGEESGTKFVCSWGPERHGILASSR